MDRSAVNAYIDVENPVTQEMIAKIPKSDERDVDAAVASAYAAFPAWAATEPEKRLALLKEAING